MFGERDWNNGLARCLCVLNSVEKKRKEIKEKKMKERQRVRERERGGNKKFR